MLPFDIEQRIVVDYPILLESAFRLSLNRSLNQHELASVEEFNANMLVARELERLKQLIRIYPNMTEAEIQR